MARSCMSSLTSGSATSWWVYKAGHPGGQGPLAL